MNMNNNNSNDSWNSSHVDVDVDDDDSNDQHQSRIKALLLLRSRSSRSNSLQQKLEESKTAKRPATAHGYHPPQQHVSFGTLEFLRKNSRVPFSDKTAALIGKISEETGYKGQLAMAMSGSSDFVAKKKKNTLERPLTAFIRKQISSSSTRPNTASSMTSTSTNFMASTKQPRRLPMYFNRRQQLQNQHHHKQIAVVKEPHLGISLDFFRQNLKKSEWKTMLKPNLVEVPVYNIPPKHRSVSAPLMRGDHTSPPHVYGRPLSGTSLPPRATSAQIKIHVETVGLQDWGEEIAATVINDEEEDEDVASEQDGNEDNDIIDVSEVDDDEIGFRIGKKDFDAMSADTHSGSIRMTTDTDDASLGFGRHTPMSALSPAIRTIPSKTWTTTDEIVTDEGNTFITMTRQATETSEAMLAVLAAQRVEKIKAGFRKNFFERVKSLQQKKSDGELGHSSSKTLNAATLVSSSSGRLNSARRSSRVGLLTPSLLSPAAARPSSRRRSDAGSTISAVAAAATSAEAMATEEFIRRCQEQGITPVPLMFGRPDLVDVNLSGFGINDKTASALARGIALTPSLRTLNLASNAPGNSLQELLEALNQQGKLSFLDLSDIGMKKVTSTFDQLMTRCSALEALRLSGAHLESMEDIKKLFQCLVKAPKLRRLDLSKSLNRVMGKELAEQCGLMMKTCSKTLEELDLSWNAIRLSAAETFSRGLAQNLSLVSLNLSWNGFGDGSPCFELMQAVKSCKTLKRLNLSYNRIRDRSALIIAEALQNLPGIEELILDGNPLGRVGGMSIFQAFSEFVKFAGAWSTSSSSTARSRHPKSTNNSIEVQWPSSLSRPAMGLSLNGCSLSNIDPTLLDPYNPQGIHHLDVSQYPNRAIVAVLCRMAFSGKGTIVPESIKLDGVRYHALLTSSTPSGGIPSRGNLSFSFVSKQQPPEVEDCIAKESFLVLIKLLSVMSSERGREEVLEMLVNSNIFFTLKQGLRLLEILQGNKGERIRFLSRSLHRVVGDDAVATLLNALGPSERKEFCASVGEYVMAYNRNNPTGHYRLNLSSPVEREVACRLMEQRVAMMSKGPAPPGVPERFLVNLTHEGAPVKMKPTWTLPLSGIMEFDYVSSRKPPESACAISDDDFDVLIRALSIATEDLDICSIIKNACCQQYFTCAQAHTLLNSIQQVKYKQMFLILGQSRLVDWHGYYWVLDKSMMPSDQKEVRRRIGAHNAFDPVSAVAYYELDLSDENDRWVASQLLQLAVNEPGENLLYTHFNGLVFTVPSSWENECPKKGIFIVYYCRSQKVINRIMSKADKRGIPPNYLEFQPAGLKWVVHARHIRIRNKLLLKFPDPVSCFLEADDDGSGCITRKEFARFLRNNDIQLEPHELKDLMEALDSDGGGEIELEELESWWYQKMDEEEDATKQKQAEKNKGKRK